jgi:hypothetical protein
MLAIEEGLHSMQHTSFFFKITGKYNFEREREEKDKDFNWLLENKRNYSVKY